MLRNSRPAFTLLESLLALVVMGMVFLGLSYLIRGETLRQSSVTAEKLIVLCHQLQQQGYTLERAEENQLILSKEGRDGQKKLKVLKGQLILQGDNRGRMVLLDRIRSVHFQNMGSYQKVKVKGERGQRVEALLVLSEKRKENRDEER